MLLNGQPKGECDDGLVRTSADLDPRRRRILYRCWHRGIREMDLVLGHSQKTISRCLPMSSSMT